MTMPGPQAVAAAVGGRPPGLLYLTAVAGLSPLGLNAAVGLAPVIDGVALGTADRAAAVALFTLGLGLGQPAAGDAADRWGRRPTMLAGLALAGTGALAAVAAESPAMLLAGRFATGLGAATCLVVPRVVLRDLHQGAALQRSMAVLSFVFALLPAVTPPLAWALAHAFSWRAPLVMVAACVLGAAALAWVLHRETRPAHTRVPAGSAWLALARHREVRRATIALAGAAAPFFIVAAVGPAALRESAGLGAGAAAALLGATYLGFALGSQWVRRRAHVPARVHVTAGLVLAAASMALLCATLAWPSPWTWALALACHAAGHGIVFPAAFALVLQRMPQQAGLATAAIGTVHMCAGAIGGWVAGALPTDAHPALVATAAAAVAAACGAWFLPTSSEDER